ncbi:hypothetical protein GII33_09040 [Gordonia pseudamarae]|uniref:hypothetical protein n=1 Tax=Gordonia TaxID=2053 RepID=UPI0019A6E615|nr:MULTISPECIES: hypothetical protein [Gordonia]MBD0021073.1 hypothetical protein [Gordonia sp. (in: high G+C Gram-positive bacteria)]QHN26089.1 hypothetical protein GII33_09040 [Gordonia pseudamarae]
MPDPHTSPATSTATRSGAKVVVTRTDDVRDGAEPIVSVMVDSGEIMAFTPTTAADLSAMLARAATAEIAVKIRVTNSYPDRSFEHTYDVVAPAPRDDEDVYDWCYDHLWQYTGEGPQYANVPAAYEVEILSAPAPFEHLIGLKVDSYG